MFHFNIIHQVFLVLIAVPVRLTAGVTVFLSSVCRYAPAMVCSERTGVLRLTRRAFCLLTEPHAGNAMWKSGPPLIWWGASEGLRMCQEALNRFVALPAPQAPIRLAKPRHPHNPKQLLKDFLVLWMEFLSFHKHNWRCILSQMPALSGT